MICQICNQEVKDNKHFWREHKLSQESYFHQYSPRFDLLTKEVIPFRNQEQYFKQDFINRANLKQWLNLQPLDKKQEYCRNLLIQRKNEGKIVYVPSYVEIKSLDDLPPIAYYDKIFPQKYLGLCKELGLLERFYDYDDFRFHTVELDKIITDTREQKGLNLALPTEVCKLDYGDYTSEAKELFIERKSLIDFISSFGTGYDRLSREFQRSLIANKQMVVLIEEKFEVALNFNELAWIKSKTKVSPDFIFHNVRECVQSFPNVQFLFVHNRGEAARIIQKLLSTVEITKIDLQLAYSKNLL